ncbi:MAG: Sec-independent protein translocase protein TatB [Burkholderiales bacterium]
MIDFGLTKMALIGVVALVVIGPEKLPKVARMAGSLFGRAQRYLNQVKAEVSREMELDELRKMRDEIKQAAGEAEQSFARTVSQTESELNAAWNERAIGSIGSPPPPDVEKIARKSKDFRRKKLARGAVPTWYKHQNGHKTRVISAAARVARYRPAGFAGKATFFQQ